LSHHPEPSGHAVCGEVDGLDIGEQHGQWFVLFNLRNTHKSQRRPYPICDAGAERSHISAEAVKPDPRSSWKGHSRKVGARVRDESAESRRVVLV